MYADEVEVEEKIDFREDQRGESDTLMSPCTNLIVE
jgi:hypothetical protein